ncbi:MAG: hypothetical protein M3R48_03595 [Candidatus Dormibacteraeota bacterium]|nr:hypothetical protein [Candidatus Dormibacteraeota bacterium]
MTRLVNAALPGPPSAAAPNPTDDRPRQSLADRLTSPGGLFLSAVLLAAAFPVTSAIRDPDFWWHLRSGQLILQRGGLLGTDPFTYTVSSHAWTMHEWLTEVLFAWLQSWGGLGAVVVVLSAVTWLGVVCVFQRARLDRPNSLVLGGGMVLAVIAGYPIWGPRAQMITFACAALTLLLAERHLRCGGRLVWLLLPMFLVWSNLHSGFLIGLAFLALIVVAEAVAHRLSIADRAPAARVRTLGLVTLCCVLVSAINLNGPGIILYPFGTLGSAAQESLILEWHSPDFHDWSVRVFAFMLLSLVALIVVNRRIRPRDAALVLATAVLSLQSVRNIALFVAAATPAWISQADLALQRLRAGRRRRARSPLPPLPIRVVSWGILCGAILLIYLGGRLIPAARIQQLSLSYAEEFPVCAANWIAADPRPLRIFNQYGEGGYLAYRLSAQGDRVFIFGDAALMGDDLLYTYGAVESVQPRWDSILRGDNTDLVIFDTGTPLANLLAHATDWVRVYADQHNVAYAPTDRLAALHLPPLPTYPAVTSPGSVRASDVCTQLHDTPASQLNQAAG